MRRKVSAASQRPRKTIGYIRVSTQDQAADGVSLDAQEARIAAYAAAMGFDVSEVIRDAGESAKSLQRPGMTHILEGVRAGSIGRVVVLKLDRLTRSTRDLADVLDLLAKSDAALVSVSENLDTASACGRLVLNVIGSVAQWEREAIAERTALALSHKRQQRSVYGAIPFGYRRVGDKLVPIATEQAALQEASLMDRRGASYREIAAMLTAGDAKPKRGKKWYASSVRAMLRSRIATESSH